MNKKVIKEIVYDGIESLEYGIGITINGECLIDMDEDKALKLLKDNNLIKGDDIIIPIGLELTEVKYYGNVNEYNFNNGFIIVDLTLEKENEFIV